MASPQVGVASPQAGVASPRVGAASPQVGVTPEEGVVRQRIGGSKKMELKFTK